MSVSTPTCVACGGREFRKLFTKKGRDFWRCRGCGYETIYPLPTRDQLQAYYEASYAEGMYSAFVAAAEMKRLTARRRLEMTRPHCRPGPWLDVGCSDGTFVEEARRDGIDAEGIELSAAAVETATRRGLPVRCGTIDEAANGRRFSTVSAFDLLEHVLDPVASLAAIHRVLEPGGALVLTVPNVACLPRRLMGRRWYFYIPEEHLHYFDPTSIRLLLGRSGFTVERVARAMKSLTWQYTLGQFQEYNPRLHRLLQGVSRLLPARLRERPVHLYIGEMLVIARRAPGAAV